jgi:hypothetical protein
LETQRSFTGEAYPVANYDDYLDNPQVWELVDRWIERVNALDWEGMDKETKSKYMRAARDLFSQPDDMFLELMSDESLDTLTMLGKVKNVEKRELEKRRTYKGTQVHHDYAVRSTYDNFEPNVPSRERFAIFKQLKKDGYSVGIGEGALSLGNGGHQGTAAEHFVGRDKTYGEDWKTNKIDGLDPDEVYRNNINAHSNPHADDAMQSSRPYNWELQQKIRPGDDFEDAYYRMIDEVIGPQRLMNRAGAFNPREVAARNLTVSSLQAYAQKVHPDKYPLIAGIDPNISTDLAVRKIYRDLSIESGINQAKAQDAVIRGQSVEGGRLKFSSDLPLIEGTAPQPVVPKPAKPKPVVAKPAPTATVTPKPDPIAYIPDTAARKAGHQSIAQRVAQPTVKPAIPEGNITKLKPKGPRGVKAPKGVGRAARSLAIMAPLAGASLLASGAEAKERSDEANRNPTALNKGKSAVANFGLAADGLALTPLAPIAEPASMGAAVVNMGLDALPSVVKNAPKVTKAVTSTMNAVHQAPAKAATQVLKEGKKWLKQLGINL